VKASPESGAFNRGWSRGQQVRKPLVREVEAVLPLSVQENRGKEGRGERPKLREPEAGMNIRSSMLGLASMPWAVARVRRFRSISLIPDAQTLAPSSM
jgi:hypothetical protein